MSETLKRLAFQFEDGGFDVRGEDDDAAGLRDALPIWHGGENVKLVEVELRVLRVLGEIFAPPQLQEGKP